MRLMTIVLSVGLLSTSTANAQVEVERTSFTVRKLYVVPLVSDQSELVLYDTRPVGQKQQIRVTFMTPVKTTQFESTGDGVYRLRVPISQGHAFIESEYGFVSAYTSIMGATFTAVDLNTQVRLFNGSIRKVDGKIHSTGIAVVNPSSISSNFTLWVKKEGDRTIDFQTFRISGGSQMIRFLHELIPNLPEGDYSVKVVGGEFMSTNTPGVLDRGLAVAAVSYNFQTGLFETVPVKAAGVDR